jgi:hypothetical protein
MVAPAVGHWNVPGFVRAGAAPSREGNGWRGQCFLNIPAESAQNLLLAERYIIGRQPDFTFRTDWIDFPAGPIGTELDSSFETIGDFLNDYIHDVSDPTKLNEPFGHFLLRFRGMLKVTFEENNDELMLLPVWVTIGCNGFDGYRARVYEDASFRLPTVNPADAFYWEHFFFHLAGLFPFEITYFNRHDPIGGSGFERAGIEVYSWHGGGLPWPAGERLTHRRFGPSTVIPPRVIYQPQDVLPVQRGDFDTDFDYDLHDLQWLQNCFTGEGGEEGGVDLAPDCQWMDLDRDKDVDGFDYRVVRSILTGPL